MCPSTLPTGGEGVCGLVQADSNTPRLVHSQLFTPNLGVACNCEPQRFGTADDHSFSDIGEGAAQVDDEAIESDSGTSGLVESITEAG